MKRSLTLMALLAMLTMPSAALAQDELTTAGLQAVIRNQEKILQALEEIKAELQIVKVRATQK